MLDGLSATGTDKSVSLIQLHTTAVPADIVETMELIRDLRDGGRNDCIVQRNKKDREA